MSDTNPCRRARARGFGLVEMMVSITIGLLVMAAVTTLMVDSKKNYVVQDSMARLQENARFAMQMLVRDIRMAGYYGCADDVTAVTNTLNGANLGASYDATAPIQGLENSTWYPAAATPVPAPANIVAGTDAVAIRYLDSSISTVLDAPFMPNTSAALHTANGNGLAVGDIVFVSDCSSAAIFQITGPSDPNGGTIVHSDNNAGGTSPGNSTKDLGKIFESDAKISKYYYAMYYIAPGASGQPTLHRQTVNSATPPQELAEGVESLQLLYGEDTIKGDRIPDVYLKADKVTNWSNVVSVRIGLLVRTQANSDAPNKKYGDFKDTTTTYDVDGDGVDDYTVAAGDEKYERRVFRNTVTLRNRQ